MSKKKDKKAIFRIAENLDKVANAVQDKSAIIHLAFIVAITISSVSCCNAQSLDLYQKGDILISRQEGNEYISYLENKSDFVALQSKIKPLEQIAKLQKRIVYKGNIRLLESNLVAVEPKKLLIKNK